MNEARQVKVLIHSKGQCCHIFRQVIVVNSSADKCLSKRVKLSAHFPQWNECYPLGIITAVEEHHCHYVNCLFLVSLSTSITSAMHHSLTSCRSIGAFIIEMSLITSLKQQSQVILSKHRKNIYSYCNVFTLSISHSFKLLLVSCTEAFFWLRILKTLFGIQHVETPRQQVYLKAFP